MKKLGLALVALTAVTPAFAQDAAADYTADYTGGYVGIVTGYDSVDLNTAGVDNPQGLAYGFSAGYDVQAGPAVLGIEGEITESTARLKDGAGAEVAAASRDLYLGGRIGLVAGKTLIYAKAGYTNARIETILGNENGDGVRVGGGVEYRLTPKVALKGEYRYSNYEADLERQQVTVGVAFRF